MQLQIMKILTEGTVTAIQTPGQQIGTDPASWHPRDPGPRFQTAAEKVSTLPPIFQIPPACTLPHIQGQRLLAHEEETCTHTCKETIVEEVPLYLRTDKKL